MKPTKLPKRPTDLDAPLWEEMDRQPRHAADAALRIALSERRPGVYAWYRAGHAVYVGKGDDLYDRIWSRHMGQSRSMHTPVGL